MQSGWGGVGGQRAAQHTVRRGDEAEREPPPGARTLQRCSCSCTLLLLGRGREWGYTFSLIPCGSCYENALKCTAAILGHGGEVG